MSAFIMGQDEINKLVNLMLYGPDTAPHSISLLGRCLGYPMKSPNWRGRRYLVGSRVLETRQVKEVTEETAQTVGQLLLNENTRSVNYRYGQDDNSELFAWNPWEPRTTALAGLKTIHCFEYQCCEHPEWEDSEAYWIVQSLKDSLIEALPGYDSAPGW